MKKKSLNSLQFLKSNMTKKKRYNYTTNHYFLYYFFNVNKHVSL